MTRTQFDNNFSLFQLSEIIQSSESNSQTKKIYKYEALIRYIEDDGTQIPPYKFLPIAKKAKLFSGIIKLMVTECLNFIKNNLSN